MTRSVLIDAVCRACPEARPEVVRAVVGTECPDDPDNPGWSPYTRDHVRRAVERVRRLG